MFKCDDVSIAWGRCSDILYKILFEFLEHFVNFGDDALLRHEHIDVFVVGLVAEQYRLHGGFVTAVHQI